RGQLLLALAQLLVGAPPLADVARDLGESPQPAGLVPQRGQHHAGPEAAAVAPLPPALVLEPPDPLGRRQLPLWPPGGRILGGEEQAERAAQHLFGPVALQALGARVPAGHP